MSWSTSNFYFGDLIGEGFFGKVYHAKHKQKEGEGLPHSLPTNGVAIKTMDKTQIVKNGNTKMVLRERNTLAKLSHFESRRTVQLFMSFVDDQNLYLVLELCEFGTLSALRREKKLSMEAIRNFSGQILSAVEFMHYHSVVHCDLKPDNVMIAHNFQIKIGDFGCAMDVSLGDCSEIDFVGTSDYVSPEVIKGSTGTFCESEDDKGAVEITLNLKKPLPVFQLEHAFAIDLWAFGCLLYFILEGVSPFHDRSDELALRRIIQYVKRDEKICLEYFKRTRSLEGGGDMAMSTTSSKSSSMFEDGNKCLLDLVNHLLIADPPKRLGMGKVKPKHNNTYTSIRSHNFYLGFDWCQIDKEEEFDEHHRNMFQTLLSSPSIRTDVKQEEMQDGACLPFDFFA